MNIKVELSLGNDRVFDDVRWKLYETLLLIFEDVFFASSVASLVSSSRKSRIGKEAQLVINVRSENNETLIHLLFTNMDDESLAPKCKKVFEKVFINHSGLNATTWFPIVTSDSVLSKSKEILITKGRDELVAEMLEKNQELEEHKVGLESKVAARTKDLAVAVEVAQAAEQAKGDFLANMSHEIRTPMNAIIGLTDLCLRTDLTEQQKDYLVKTGTAAKNLLVVLNDVLDFSKIEAGKLELEITEFKLDDLIKNLSVVVSPNIQKKGLEFLYLKQPGVPSQLKGDPLRLNQILINLVGNAVKFTEDGQISIEIELRSRNTRAELHFAVIDTGIGMTEEQLGRMFQSFSQADNSITRQYGGTGLGLAISKQLVELMGGEIWVTSEYGVGSRFQFTASFDIGEPEELPVEELTYQKRRALVVDDNEAARIITGVYFEAFGVLFDFAENGQEAQQLYSKNEYDYIVMDLLLDQEDGLEVLNTMIGQASHKSPKTILLSSATSERIYAHPLSNLPNVILQKPITQSDLLDALVVLDGGQSTHTRSSDENHEFLDPIRGASILLVEDNEINQQVATEILSQEGFIVEVAENGKEAIDTLAIKEFDCVLMDVHMPVMDGYTATGLLRQQSRYDDLPIIAMTANATLKDQEQARDVGMNAHVAKPIEQPKLFRVLSEYIHPLDRSVVPAPERKSMAPKTKLATFASLEGIDTNAGLARVGHNAELYSEILQKFRKNSLSFIDELKSAIEQGDLESASRLAHTLKGVSASLGANKLAEHAAVLETTLHHAEIVEDNLLNMTSEELALVMNSIAQLQEEPNAENVPILSEAEIIAELKELLIKLEGFDTEASSSVKSLIKAASADYLNLLQKVQDALSEYDFDLGAELIQNKLDES